MNKRETETRGGKENRKIEREGGERDCSLCLVVTARPYIQPPLCLIGLRRVRWVEGEGGAWRRIEKKEGESRRRRGTCVEGVDGVQRMQRQTWKIGRLLTSHSDTDNVKREERRLTLTAHPGLYSASAKWLLFTEIYQLFSPESFYCHLAEEEECA